MISAKGKEEIEKRKYFLLRVNNQSNHETESLNKSAVKRSIVSSQASGSVRKENANEPPPGEMETEKPSAKKDEGGEEQPEPAEEQAAEKPEEDSKMEDS